MTDELFSIRAASTQDLPAINAMAAAEGMGTIAADDLVYVAANADDQVVGFIRLVADETYGYHVNPVVAYPTWRRYGVGKALMEYALDCYGELRLVSRGGSLAFYEALGYEPISWDMICPAVAAECDGCEMIDECGPTPMRKVK